MSWPENTKKLLWDDLNKQKSKAVTSKKNEVAVDYINVGSLHIRKREDGHGWHVVANRSAQSSKAEIKQQQQPRMVAWGHSQLTLSIQKLYESVVIDLNFIWLICHRPERETSQQESLNVVVLILSAKNSSQLSLNHIIKKVKYSFNNVMLRISWLKKKKRCNSCNNMSD